MDAESLGVGQTFHQGKLEEVSHHLVEGEEISGSLLKRRIPVGRAVPDEFLWDIVRSQECAETQEFGCRRIHIQQFTFSEDDDGAGRALSHSAEFGFTLMQCSFRLYTVGDVAADPRYLTAFGTTRSEIIVPVFGGAGGNVVGTIDVESEKPNAFSEDVQAFLEACSTVIRPLWRR